MLPACFPTEADFGESRKMEPIVHASREYGELMDSILMLVFAVGIDSVERQDDVVSIHSRSRSGSIQDSHVRQ